MICLSDSCKPLRKEFERLLFEKIMQEIEKDPAEYEEKSWEC
jgi:hypothetical protein